MSSSDPWFLRQASLSDQVRLYVQANEQNYVLTDG